MSLFTTELLVNLIVLLYKINDMEEEARFCEDCPMRGSCEGPVVLYKCVPTGEIFTPTTKKWMYGAVCDNQQRISEPLVVPLGLDAHEILAAIRECRIPLYQERGWIKRRTVAECQAIGQYACNDRRLKQRAREYLGRYKVEKT